MMNRKVFFNLTILLILGLILAFSACGMAPGNKTGTIAPSVSASAVAAVSESTVAATAVTPLQGNTVNIKGFQFDPETVEIKKGDKVIWKNEDSAIHTVTFDTFDSGSMKQGDTFEHAFDTAGSFSYYCGNHPSMKGTVKVN